LQLPSAYKLSAEAAQALDLKLPVVALESAVITHGLPYPQNLSLAQDMEADVRDRGVAPVTIAVLDGKLRLGLERADLERLASDQDTHKIGARDFAGAIAKGWSGGTTVSGTLLAAGAAGIEVFATGGIGGVHRGAPFDVSTDLYQLASTPVVVVCAGAKAILDLPATLEMLESLAVPVVGYRTNEFPAFYSAKSGLPVGVRADSAEEIATMTRSHWDIGLSSSLLVVTPPPDDAALPPEVVDLAIQQALEELEARGVRGQGVTPFLLARVSELTGGASLNANLALLRNNARLAAEVARALNAGRRDHNA
jgi:pseudouridine-5'-phosphate glycosidase